MTWTSTPRAAADAPKAAADLQAIADAARSLDEIEAAVVFVLDPGGETLAVRGAAGIDGAALEGLATAARNPDHRIPKALAADAPEWDVLPMNPGGPRLRSHLPLHDGGPATGVLALAHEEELAPHADVRAALEALADEAARATRAP